MVTDLVFGLDLRRTISQMTSSDYLPLASDPISWVRNAGGAVSGIPLVSDPEESAAVQFDVAAGRERLSDAVGSCGRFGAERSHGELRSEF